MKKINIGIIGTSRMAEVMLKAMQSQPQINVHGVFGHSSERTKNLATKFSIPNAYTEIDALLNNTEIDAVYIASVNEKHAFQTLKALKAGKSVLCEKPMAISLEESHAIQTQAKKSNCLCMEAMWTHFLPSYQRLFETSENKTLGQALNLFADFGYPASEDVYPKLFSAELGGGVLLDRAVYPIALAIKTFGDVAQVQSEVSYNTAGADTDANILLKHSNGVCTQLAVSAKTLLQNRAVLSCTQGSLSLEPPLLGSETVVTEHFYIQNSNGLTTGGFKTLLKEKLKNATILRKFKALKPRGKKEYLGYGVNQYLPMLNHFCELVNQKKTQSDVVPLALSHQVMTVIAQIKQDK